MKSPFSPLDYILWITMIACQVAACTFAFSSGIQRLHPRFMFYLGYIAARSGTLILICLLLPYSWYYWSFYGGVVIETILLMLVVYEIFRNTFDPLGVLPPGTIARMAGWMIIGAAIIVTFGIWKPAPTSGFADELTALLRTAHRTITCAVCIALWSLVMYARSLAIPWRSRTAGIAAGFLLLFSVESFTRAGQSFAPHAWFALFDRFLIAVFLAVLILWMRAMRRPEEIATELPTPDTLQKARLAIVEMRATVGAIKVAVKTKWSVE